VVVLEWLVLMSERSHILVCAKQRDKKQVEIEKKTYYFGKQILLGQAEIEENILFWKTNTLESNSYLVC
jgi:hypothetical protein